MAHSSHPLVRLQKSTDPGRSSQLKRKDRLSEDSDSSEHSTLSNHKAEPRGRQKKIPSDLGKMDILRAPSWAPDLLLPARDPASSHGKPVGSVE